MPVDDPYVGPRPFERADAARFFGRQRDARELASLVVAHRVLLLYSASGAGKSSLVNAGAVPLLEQKGFEVLPTMRVGPVRAASPDGNPFTSALAAQLGSPEASIAGALQTRARPLDYEGESVPRALIVDQFEELFTAHPELWSLRAGLIDGLREALEADERLRVVLVMREEYVARLEPYAPHLPGALRMRFRLERLDQASAFEAVTRPLEGTGRSFAPGVAEGLVEGLLTLRVETAPGTTVEVPGEFVEPVHLQVVCRRLWAELPRHVTQIRAEHVRALADLDTVLARFYDEAIAAAHAEAGVSERRLRRWVKDELITPGGTRSTVYRGGRETAGLSNDAVAALEEKRLVRAEQRAGALWYELTHDRLIEPIRQSNAQHRAARRKRQGALLAVVTAVAAMAGIAFAMRGGGEFGGGAGAGLPLRLFGPVTLPSGRVYFDGETMYVRAARPRRPLIHLASLEDVGDVAMSARVAWVSGGRDYGVGFICRYESAARYYLLAVLSGGRYNLVKYRDGAVTSLSGGIRQTDALSDEANTFSAQCVGDQPTTLTLHANGQTIGMAKDDDGFARGNIGVRVGSAESSVTLRFDDLVLKT